MTLHWEPQNVGKHFIHLDLKQLNGSRDLGLSDADIFFVGVRGLGAVLGTPSLYPLDAGSTLRPTVMTKCSPGNKISWLQTRGRKVSRALPWRPHLVQRQRPPARARPTAQTWPGPPSAPHQSQPAEGVQLEPKKPGQLPPR